MNNKQLALAARRGALTARSAAQREAFVAHADALKSVLAIGDSALRGVDWVRRHPLAVGLAVMLTVAARPKRAWRWTRRGLIAWRAWQGVRNLLAGRR